MAGASCVSYDYLARYGEGRLTTVEVIEILESGDRLLSHLSVMDMIAIIASIPCDATGAPILARLLHVFLRDCDVRLVQCFPHLFVYPAGIDVPEVGGKNSVEHRAILAAVNCLSFHFYSGQANSELKNILLEYPFLFAMLCRHGERMDLVVQVLLLDSDVSRFVRELLAAVDAKLVEVEKTVFKTIFTGKIQMLMMILLRFRGISELGDLLAITINRKTLRQYLRFFITGSWEEDAIGTFISTAQPEISPLAALLCVECLWDEVFPYEGVGSFLVGLISDHMTQMKEQKKRKLISLSPIFAAKFDGADVGLDELWQTRLDSASIWENDDADVFKLIACRDLLDLDGDDVQSYWNKIFGSERTVSRGRLELILYALQTPRYQVKLLGDDVSIDMALLDVESNLHFVFNAAADEFKQRFLGLSSANTGSIDFAKQAVRGGMEGIYRFLMVRRAMLENLTYADIDELLPALQVAFSVSRGLFWTDFLKLFDEECILHPGCLVIFDSLAPPILGGFFQTVNEQYVKRNPVLFARLLRDEAYKKYFCNADGTLQLEKAHYFLNDDWGPEPDFVEDFAIFCGRNPAVVLTLILASPYHCFAVRNINLVQTMFEDEGFCRTSMLATMVQNLLRTDSDELTRLVLSYPYLLERTLCDVGRFQFSALALREIAARVLNEESRAMYLPLVLATTLTQQLGDFFGGMDLNAENRCLLLGMFAICEVRDRIFCDVEGGALIALSRLDSRDVYNFIAFDLHSVMGDRFLLLLRNCGVELMRTNLDFAYLVLRNHDYRSRLNREGLQLFLLDLIVSFSAEKVGEVFNVIGKPEYAAFLRGFIGEVDSDGWLRSVLEAKGINLWVEDDGLDGVLKVPDADGKPCDFDLGSCEDGVATRCKEAAENAARKGNYRLAHHYLATIAFASERDRYVSFGYDLRGAAAIYSDLLRVSLYGGFLSTAKRWLSSLVQSADSENREIFAEIDADLLLQDFGITRLLVTFLAYEATLDTSAEGVVQPVANYLTVIDPARLTGMAVEQYAILRYYLMRFNFVEVDAAALLHALVVDPKLLLDFSLADDAFKANLSFADVHSLVSEVAEDKQVDLALALLGCNWFYMHPDFNAEIYAEVTSLVSASALKALVVDELVARRSDLGLVDEFPVFALSELLRPGTAAAITGARGRSALGFGNASLGVEAVFTDPFAVVGPG